MKLSIATLFLLPAFASAFIASPPRAFVSTEMRAAATFEEDLELTREVIAKFMDGKDDEPAKEEEPAKKKNTDKEE